jgi:very-short-patch-repair endonuclease
MKEFDEKVIDMYTNKNQSTYDIAEELDTYPNKVRRTLKKHGYELKSRSEAQAAALTSGRSTHPTAGKKRTLKERVAISSSLVDYWERMSDDERKRRVETAKTNWDKMSDQQKESMRSKGIAAIRTAASEGSKLEKVMQESIEAVGHVVELHKMLIPSEKLEIDLYIPSLKTIIEVDGPSHFLPIWGEDKLKKQVNADLRKSGTLLTKGYAVIRVKSLGQESLAKREQLVKQVIIHLSEIDERFPPRSKRFIEVE